MLNRPGPRDPPHIQPADRDLSIDTSAPTREEIRKTIKKLRNGKVAGPDSIPAEALKIDTETIEEMLHTLSKKIWEEENIPFEWKEGCIFKMPKKGDLSNCANYREITLLSIPGKVFYRIVLDRMKDVVDPQLRDQRAGFRKDRSCIDQIATLRIILEQSLEWNSPLYVNFIDYKKAFDGQGDPVEASQTLLSAREANQHHKKHLRGNDLPGDPRGPTHRLLLRTNRSEAGLPAIAFLVAAGYGLDDEAIHSGQEKWHTVDNVDAAK